MKRRKTRHTHETPSLIDEIPIEYRLTIKINSSTREDAGLPPLEYNTPVWDTRSSTIQRNMKTLMKRLSSDDPGRFWFVSSYTIRCSTHSLYQGKQAL